MFFKTPRKSGAEMASVFRQQAVPAFHGTQSMRDAAVSGTFRFPNGFFGDDYCLGFLFGSLDIYILKTGNPKWSKEKKVETMFHAASLVNNEPDTLKRYGERRDMVLLNDDHPLNKGYEHGLTLAATTLRIIRPEEYETNQALVEAVSKVKKNGLNFTTSEHEEICFYLFTGTLKKHVDEHWRS